MPGVFDLSEQHDDLDAKLIVVLERLSQTLRVMLWDAAKEASLSPIQTQILIFLRYQPNYRLSDLAKRFDLTKATLSDAVKTLENKALIKRISDPKDARASFLQLTPLGKKSVQKVEHWAEPAKDQLTGLNQKSKIDTLLLLMTLIEKLQATERITVARMCTTCHFLEARGQRYHCRLLGKSLEPEALRIDCPDHQMLIA